MDGRLLSKLDQVHSFLWKDLDERSETYSCTVPGFQGRVAVKVFGSTTQRGSETAQVLKDLDHPNLIRLLHVLSLSPLCLVLELCQGGSLHTLLHEASSTSASEFSVDQRLRAVAQAVSGVAYLHGKDIVHSAVRPNNIFLSRPVSRGPEGIIMPQVILGDLGLARFLAPEDNESSLSLGILRYTAPEVILRASHEPLSDVYSCSVMMHEVLTASLPFSDLNIPSHILVLKVCAGLRPNLNLLPECGAAKPQIASILASAWEEDLHSRTTSEELEHSLFELIHQRWQSSPAVGA
ncbi:unnamed protein product [Prorocentrum cordatum]|uniref:Protein kinase domain-containing protein n=1 Tax=Prorocentrum cordatum TaxID=2364126 RepID=A0ABN9V2B6_9DINO|nr:unnamed protein product [Polarella glacialis]